MTEIHAAAADGFEAGADVYERARPEYPEAATDWLIEGVGLAPGQTVLDLAAGTGKLTRRLASSGADVIAVEPVAAMRAVLERSLTDATVLEGTAEAIPLAAASVEAVTAAQAFHWFDTDRALPEIVRVLRPGGVLAVVLNMRQPGPLFEAFHTLIDPYRGDTPRHRDQRWRRELSESSLFGAPNTRAFPFEQLLDRGSFSDFVFSISFMAALPAEERPGVEARIDELCGTTVFPLAMPYTCEVSLYPLSGSLA